MVGFYTNLLVPVDGSEQSLLALRKSIAIARRNNAKLFIAHVVDNDFTRYLTHYDATVTDRVAARGDQILNEAEGIVQQEGLDNYDRVISRGAPKVLISDELVKAHNIDLIIMGASGLNAVEKFLLGSTSEYVIRNADCDVLIVR